MIFYLNGAEHTAAAKSATSFVWAMDDPAYVYNGRNPHPSNLPAGFGRQLNMALNCTLNNEAIPGSSNDRIIRKTTEFLDTKIDEQVFVMILWAPWDREEWKFNNLFHQISMDEFTPVDKLLQKRFKKAQNGYNPEKKQKLWHDRIWKFHKELNDRGVKHLFGTESQPFDLIKKKHRWGSSFVTPYKESFTDVCAKSVNPDGDGYFQSAGHLAYMLHIVPHCVKILS